MYCRVNDRRHPVLLLLISLTCWMVLTAQSPVTSARGQGGSAMRLRLTVQRDTIRMGETTKIIAEFLDRDYRQVPNDGTRVIEFGSGSADPKLTGSGDISPRQVTVRPGSWSAETIFAPRQTGRVLITAHTDGLDPAQALLVVRPAGSSFLSKWFETVAYADESDELTIWPDRLEATANGNSLAVLQVSFLREPSLETEIRICVKPPATIVQNGKDVGTMTSVKLAAKQSNSEHIGVKSSSAAKVEVSATVLPRGPKESVFLNFIEPEPKRIIIESEQQTIPSTRRAVPISIQLTDDGGFPIAFATNRERKIRLSSDTDSDLVSFEPQTMTLTRESPSAHSIMRFNQPPRTGEITVLASDERNTLKTGQKIIVFERAIVTAARWLLLAAIFGGAIGGLARQLHKADRLDRILPQWTGKYWDLGLTGRIAGSVVSGLFLYWTMKLGLARVTLDLGSTTVAFFFGVIGGFAGLVVLDRLVEWCFKLLRWSLPGERHGSAPAASAPATSTLLKTP